nr:cation diffusion facilitator family transporter [Lachnospiraceae bacterium]
IITIVGTKLAGKEPDRKHPMGHGRVEYLTAMIISIIVMYAGVTSLVESVKKITQPEDVSYNTASLVIVVVAIVVKLVLGLYVKGVGQKVNSDSLVNSGADAMLDSVISASTLLAAILYLAMGWKLEAWLGALISLVILKAGVEMLQGTISQILGERVESSIAHAIKTTCTSVEGVHGAYDLTMHNYGPDRYVASIHVEVDDTLTAAEIDVIEREVSRRVYEEHGILMSAVGIYSRNTKNDYARKVFEDVRKIVLGHEGVIQIHGFYLDEQRKTMSFDIIIAYDTPDRKGLFGHIQDEIATLYPQYHVSIQMDLDLSD